VGVGRERICEVIQTVGLAGREHQVVGSELLVLDEPTVGLDPVLRAELWETFHDLAAAGRTLLISSHVMDEASECEELLLMRDGTLLEQTTPEQLRRQTGEQDLGRAFLAIIERASS